MKLSDDAKYVVASNLTVAAALIQVANATAKKDTKSNGEDEALTIFRSLFARIERGEVG
jgi:hypothetical protein